MLDLEGFTKIGLLESSPAMISAFLVVGAAVAAIDEVAVDGFVLNVGRESFEEVV